MHVYTVFTLYRGRLSLQCIKRTSISELSHCKVCHAPLSPFRLLAVGLTYVVVGVLVKKYRYEAHGMELIPNYHFWKDFPFLLKVESVYTSVLAIV